MGNRGDDRDGVRVYCTRGHACWVAVVLLIAVGVVVAKFLVAQTPVGPLVPGVVAFVLLVIAALIIIAEVNTGIEAGEGGLTVREWPHPDRFVPWRRVAAMRWRHAWWRWLAERLCLRRQPGAHGVVELAVTDDAGTPHWTTVANYICCGGAPGALREMLDEIVERARLSQVSERPMTLHPKFEETEWARSGS